MAEPAPPFDWRRMGPAATNIAKQMLDAARVDGFDDDVFHDDLIGMAAHLLTMPLDRASENGTLVTTIERFREIMRKAVEHESLDPSVLAVLGGMPASDVATVKGLLDRAEAAIYREYERERGAGSPRFREIVAGRQEADICVREGRVLLERLRATEGGAPDG